MCPSVHVRDMERGMRDKGWAKRRRRRRGGGGGRGATGRGRTEGESEGATEEKDRRQ